MTGHTLTDRFLKSILAITKQDPHPAEIVKAKYCLLDYIGVVLAGSSVTQEKVQKLKTFLDDHDADCPAIGIATRVSLQNSIFFNGINSHILELDDGCRYGVTHPGGPLFSALLPVAFRYKVAWDKFLKAVLVGYETILRVSTAIQPGHYKRGFHPTSTCTPLGIAVAICVMLDLPYQTVRDAFSSACISAGGSLKAIEDTSRMKALNAGRAAALGFSSYCIARAGFSGPEDALYGKTGFLNIMTSTFNEDILIRQMDDPLWILRVYCKLYASCRHTHGAIEGVLKMREKSNVDINDIARIEIKIYKGIKGKHDIFDIYGEENAKMSIPYSVAAALVYGNANDEVFRSERIANPQIRRLMDVISIVEDDYITSLLPDQRATEITVFMNDNQKHSEFIGYPIGEPENPVDFEGLTNKFVHLVRESGRTTEYADEIISAIFSDMPDMMRLNSILYRSRND